MHFLKALETGARKVYLVGMPQGRAAMARETCGRRKRIEYAKTLVREVGLPDDCFELIITRGPTPRSIDDIARGLLGLGAAATSARKA